MKREPKKIDHQATTKRNAGTQPPKRVVVLPKPQLNMTIMKGL